MQKLAKLILDLNPKVVRIKNKGYSMYKDDGKSAISPDLFQNLFEKDYKTAEAYHRINQDFNGELETRDSYKGREILEMLQNAEDQKSSYFFISVNTSTKTICFYNGGEPFSKKGFDAILYAKTSPKQGNLASIGNKGLGFRSILNWAEAVDIYSRHTHVSFSVKIAKKKWEELRKFFSDKGFIDNIKEIQSNANRLRENKHEINVPLSVFAVPKAATYDELPIEFLAFDNEISTVIKVKYKSELQKGILDQIKAIHNETLLFIKNIKKITIQVDDAVTTICKDLSEQEPWNEGFVYKYTITNGEKTDRYSVYMEDGIYKEYEKEIEEYTEEDNYLSPKLTKKKITENYQIGIAIVEASNSETNGSASNSKGFPLYSFFETQVKTNLPCLLHGSFSLSPDRKQLQDQSDYNDFLQKKIGKKFIQFVEFFANKRQEEGLVDWFPFDQVTSLNGDSISSDLNLFKQEMDKALLEASIYPSIANGYCKLNDTIAYTENFAKLIKEKPMYVEAGFGKHLLKDFSKRKVICNTDDNFVSIINKLSELINDRYEKNSQSEDCYAERVVLLNCLYEINYKSDLFKVLTDDNHNLLLGDEKEKLYINTGKQLVQPPSFLHFQYIDEPLIKALREKWNNLLLNANQKKRDVADILQENIGLSYVSAADISRIKEKIVNVLHNKPSLDDYKAIIRCLYKSYQKEQDLNFLDKRTENGLAYYRDENNTYKDGSVNKVKDLLLLGIDGKFHPSMSLIIYDKEFPHGFENECTDSLSDEWKLYGSFDEWKAILAEDDAQKIEDFFVNVLGVSLYVPMALHGFVGDELINDSFFGQNAFVLRSCPLRHYDYWYVTDEGKFKDLCNLSFCPLEKFIREIGSNCSWEKILLLVLKSEYLYKSFLQKTINYRYQRSLSKDNLKASFIACYMKKNVFWGPVKNIIVEQRRDVVDLIAKGSGRLSYDVEGILVQLGAFRSINDLNVPRLYQLLNDVTEQFEKGEKVSIQSEYKKIRRYILAKGQGQENAIRSYASKIEKLVAKKEDKLGVFPRNEVYYWDSDEYPQAILSKIPKLEIGTKVGELSVEKIFGIKRLDGIEIEISDKSKINDMCGQNVKESLKKRFPYLLAMRCADEGIEKISSFANVLNKVDIQIYSTCFYRSNKEAEFQSAEEGDLIKQGAKYILCSNANSYENAIRNPHFSESMVEIFCLSLSRSETRWFDPIRAILKNSDEENRYYYEKNFVDRYYKDAISKAFGISEIEKKFWIAVSEKMGCPSFNEDMLAVGGKEKVEYIDSVINGQNKLAKIFDKGMPDIDNMSPEDQYRLLNILGIVDASILGEASQIQNYYEDVILDYILPKYIDRYAVFLHNKIDDIEDKSCANEDYRHNVESYLDNVEKFKIHSVFYTLAEELKNKILTIKEIDEIIREKIDDIFECKSLKLDEFGEKKVIRYNSYEKIMKKYGYDDQNLKNSILSYAYFEGFEDLFESLLIQENSKTNPPTDDSDNPNSTDGSDNPDSTGDPEGRIHNPEDWTLIPKVSKTPSGGRKPRKRKPFATPGSKNSSGKKAEEVALNWIEKQSNLEIVRGLSSNLNSLIVNGNDGARRDIAYKEKGSDVIRHLEVKSFESGTIHFSKAEYDFGSDEKNKNTYDIALVKGNSVEILKAPYTKPKFIPEPETYMISFDFEVKDG